MSGGKVSAQHLSIVLFPYPITIYYEISSSELEKWAGLDGSLLFYLRSN